MFVVARLKLPRDLVAQAILLWHDTSHSKITCDQVVSKYKRIKVYLYDMETLLLEYLSHDLKMDRRIAVRLLYTNDIYL